MGCSSSENTKLSESVGNLFTYVIPLTPPESLFHCELVTHKLVPLIRHSILNTAFVGLLLYRNIIRPELLAPREVNFPQGFVAVPPFSRSMRLPQYNPKVAGGLPIMQ